MPRLRKLPKVVPKSHTIHDNGLWPIEAEYAELGVREGWLVIYRIVEHKNGYHYHYRYPEGYKTE